MTSHLRLPSASPDCDSYGRTDGRTNEDFFSPTRDNSPSVTRTRTYGDLILGDCLEEALVALEASVHRLGSPRTGETRDEIHPWTRKAIYWRDNHRCGWCQGGFTEDRMLVLDHIKPWADGGSDRSDNLRTLCEPCNNDRSNYATDAYTRVTPVGLCDRCASYAGPVRGVIVRDHYIDPESTFRRRIFCGRCGRINDCTDPRRVL